MLSPSSGFQSKKPMENKVFGPKVSYHVYYIYSNRGRVRFTIYVERTYRDKSSGQEYHCQHGYGAHLLAVTVCCLGYTEIISRYINIGPSICLADVIPLLCVTPVVSFHLTPQH